MCIATGRHMAQRVLPRLLVLVLTTLEPKASAQTDALDYSQWRGQNRDGGASAFAEPASWPNNLTRRWSVKVGEGYATPVVVGDTVYAFTRCNDNELMTALDASTEDIKWETDYPLPTRCSQ